MGVNSYPLAYKSGCETNESRGHLSDSLQTEAFAPAELPIGSGGSSEPNVCEDYHGLSSPIYLQIRFSDLLDNGSIQPLHREGLGHQSSNAARRLAQLLRLTHRCLSGNAASVGVSVASSTSFTSVSHDVRIEHYDRTFSWSHDLSSSAVGDCPARNRETWRRNQPLII